MPKEVETSMKEQMMKTMLISTRKMKKIVDMKDMSSISKNKQINSRIKMSIILIL